MQIMNSQKKTLIIAEVGPNHNGSLKTALKMIDKIAKTGADVIKFQLAKPENVYSKDAFKAEYQKKNDKNKSIMQMSKKIQLKKEDHFKLKKACNKAGVLYACSAFDLESLKFLDKKINIPFFKIPSGEILSLDLLKYMSTSKKPILLSTGMSNFKEISCALNILNKKNKKEIIVMHCVSSYPANKKDLNLNVIDELRKRFKKKVGYSDHSLGSEACLAAVAKQVSVIEKHVTLSKKMLGPDHKSSMQIEDFKNMIKEIRNLEIMMGKSIKDISNSEKEIQKVARKSIVSKIDLKKGTILKKKYLSYKRPGIGVSPMLIKKVIGKKIIINLKKNKLIKMNYLK